MSTTTCGVRRLRSVVLASNRASARAELLALDEALRADGWEPHGGGVGDTVADYWEPETDPDPVIMRTMGLQASCGVDRGVVMSYQRLLAVIVIMLACVAPAPAAIADPIVDPGTVTIDGRTFGARDGLVVEVGQTPVGPMTRGTTEYWRGTSYAKNTETLQFKYTGRARAMANIYDGQRVIQAKFKYSRDGSDLTSWVTSNAAPRSPCSWAAGSEASKSINDTVNPVAPKTLFNYSFTYVAPGACG